jgi:hypothetical protein
MNGRLCVAAMLAALFLPSPAAAQLSAEEAAHSGIVLTPIGALPLIFRVARDADSSSRLEGQFRFGRWKFKQSPASFNNVGGTVLVRLTRRLRLGGTVGYRNCTRCDGLLLASVDGEAVLWRQNVVRGNGYATVALQGSAGIGTPDTTKLTARSVSAALPVGVSLPQSDGSMVTLFVAPGLAYGHLKDDAGTTLGYVGSDGAARGMIAAGIGYTIPLGIGVHTTVHRIAIKDSPTHIGVGVSYRFVGSQS